MPPLAPRGITKVRPVAWLPDGTGVVDQSVPTLSLFKAVLKDARDIPTRGEVRLHRHGLHALVKNRSNRLRGAIVGGRAPINSPPLGPEHEPLPGRCRNLNRSHLC